MVNSAAFAKRLQKVLDFYSLSATAFSDKIDFNRSTISHLLSGRNKPSLEFVMKVLQEFPEVELYWLLNGTGNFPSTSSEEKTESNSHVASSTASKEKVDLPQKNPTPVSKSVESGLKEAKNASDIERIILFYKDGSFKSYQ